MDRALNLKFRLTAFALAIGILALAIGWCAYGSWREVERLKAHLSTGQLQSFAIADHLQVAILELNSSLVRYDLNRRPEDWQGFQRASVALNQWIDEQKPLLKAGEELRLLNEIDAAYDVFLAAATNETDRVSSSPQGRLRHMEKIHQATAPLLGLGYALADAHRDALEQFLISSQQSVSTLRWLILASLLLLMTSLVWLSSTVYREMIAPLKMKLVESRAIIERQEKLASLGVLAAGVAHEIRNPLTAIKARLFSHQRALSKGSVALDDVAIIGSEINRLERIVRDFLQFARPSEPDLKTMAAEAPLREVRDLLAPQFERQAIQIKLGSICRESFRADPQQLKQVLINLVQNAADSIARDGHVTLCARKSAALLRGQSCAAVILEVHDTGKGISPDVQKRLFDPFFSTKEGGTGLGLSVAARIIEKHGGVLEFQTKLHHGATFGIVLPVYYENGEPS